jgi:polyhydroxybutyrate depolymerase
MSTIAVMRWLKSDFDARGANDTRSPSRPCVWAAALTAALSVAACASDSGVTPNPSTGAGGTAPTTPPATPSAGTGSTAPGRSTAGTAAPPTATGGSRATAGTSATPTATAGRASPPVATAGTGAAPAAGTGAPTTPAGGQGGPTTAGTGSTEPTTPQSCTGTGRAGRSTVMIQHAGVMRSFILDVPSSYTGDEPVPLVLNFHPLLTSASTAEGSSGWVALSNQEGFIVAFPEGQESAAWNVGPCCTQSRDVDDVGFSRAVVAKIQSEYCVDAKRVYASGFSMGGGMAHYLACEAADVFAAVAPGHFDLLEENTCAPARPITVYSFRSESDAVVMYEGGVKQNAPNGFVGEHTFLGAEGTFKKWAEIDGCTGAPEMGEGGCQTYKQCTAGVQVTLCTVGGGHTWPDAARSWAGIKDYKLP